MKNILDKIDRGEPIFYQRYKIYIGGAIIGFSYATITIGKTTVKVKAFRRIIEITKEEFRKLLKSEPDFFE